METNIVNWPSFKAKLYNRLKEFGYKGLDDRWPHPSWTKFYKEELFPKIAEDLGLHYDGHEFMTVDAVFYKKDEKLTHNWAIPMVLIESENDFKTSFPSHNKNSEFYKLCFLNAPLKIIFTFHEHWNLDQKKELIDNEGQDITNMFVKYSRLIGELVIIVVHEDGDTIIFQPYHYDENGMVKDDEKMEISS